MGKQPGKIAVSVNEGFGHLLGICDRLTFEPHDIAAQLDSRGRYEMELDREFPFVIKLFHFSSSHHTRGQTWHDRLELFMPLDGPARFRMGDQDVHLDRGDILVVDNLKLHHVLDFDGFNTRVIVISFLPEFVYSLGSPSHDYAFLLPFYSKVQNRPHIVRPTDGESSAHCFAIAELLNCFFNEAGEQYFQAGCKAYLLGLLYHLARRFRTSEILKWEFVRQQQQSLRFKNLFEHIRINYADKLTLREAAKIVGMSESQFMRGFKEVAGMTLVTYLNHVRLSNGLRLLKEPNLTIAEIAAAVGYSDQSYFDRQFKKSFGAPPKEFRVVHELEPGRVPRSLTKGE